jgi:hypothetical protein
MIENNLLYLFEMNGCAFSNTIYTFHGLFTLEVICEKTINCQKKNFIL